MKETVSGGLALLAVFGVVGTLNNPQAGPLTMVALVCLFLQYPAYMFYRGYRSGPAA